MHMLHKDNNPFFFNFVFFRLHKITYCNLFQYETEIVSRVMDCVVGNKRVVSIYRHVSRTFVSNIQPSNMYFMDILVKIL